MYKCPKCGYPTVKVSLDRYRCKICQKTWLIHELKTEEADLKAVGPLFKQDQSDPIMGE